MIEKITGSCYKSMIDYGINHLDKHCATVNELNVFPLPDGDTGTNMVMTLKNGRQSIGEDSESISRVAENFANATVFGARGNSGVITSQFFKGISEGLKNEIEADCRAFFRALDKGREYAYASVATPVEGTMLTVIKEATAAVGERIDSLDTIDEVVTLFVDEATKSLKNTPKLLPILKKAGVVDSGGAGVVYFFEGVQRYLRGEPMETVEAAVAAPEGAVDYSVFNTHSVFDYGYCTELLLQLTEYREPLDRDYFLGTLGEMGNSLVASFEADKVKVHIHTMTPEEILEFCHRFGEFLTVKIENMTVQHSQTTKKYLCSENIDEGNFAIVAVAPNTLLQNMLSEMGADVVIMSPEVPSSKDFIEAFEHISLRDILVFPNSSNSILSAMQAASLYKKAKIKVLNCRSIAQCYSAMAIIDFDAYPDAVVDEINDTIGNIYEVAVVHASKNIKYGDRNIVKNDYFALSGDEILATADKAIDVITFTVSHVLENKDCDVINLFYGQNISKEEVEKVAGRIAASASGVEVCTIPTQNSVYDFILSFE